jgi:hypothetical protein
MLERLHRKGFGYERCFACLKAWFWRAGARQPSSLAGFLMARIAQIISTARYLPEHLVTNAELTARFTALGRPHVVDKLAAKSSIGKRFYVPDDWVTSDLAVVASKEALKRAGAQVAPAPYAAWVMAPPAWLSTITGVSNQLISGSEP